MWENLKCYPMSSEGEAAILTSTAALCTLGGWGRVEAGAHYPSDVLVGFALGHFIGVFVNDARVTTANVEATNGVIHVIDAVLMPK